MEAIGTLGVEDGNRLRLLVEAENALSSSSSANGGGSQLASATGKSGDAAIRAHYELLTANQPQATVRTTPSYKMFLHPAEEDVYISKAILEGHVWDLHALLELKKVFAPFAKGAALAGQQPGPDRLGRVYPMFLDVGANIGTISMFVAGLGVETHSIEAMPHNSQILLGSARLNGFPTRSTMDSGYDK